MCEKSFRLQLASYAGCWRLSPVANDRPCSEDCSMASEDCSITRLLACSVSILAPCLETGMLTGSCLGAGALEVVALAEGARAGSTSSFGGGRQSLGTEFHGGSPKLASRWP